MYVYILYEYIRIYIVRVYTILSRTCKVQLQMQSISCSSVYRIQNVIPYWNLFDIVLYEREFYAFIKREILLCFKRNLLHFNR